MLLKLIFYILLIDAVIANLMAWGGSQRWFKKNFRLMSRNFPLTKGWTGYYLLLVIFIGYILKKYGVL